MRLSPSLRAPASPLAVRYAAGDPALAGRLGGAPGDPAALERALDLCRTRSYPRAALAAAARAMVESFGGSATARDNAAALAAPDTFVVVTGQQPGLFGGPLYTFYKAASAVALCRVLGARFGARFVPVFWIASDDHDRAEVDRAYLLADSGEVRRFRAEFADESAPAALLAVGQQALALHDEFFSALPDGALREELRERFRPRAGERLPAWFGRILSSLFAADGLVLFEPHLARGLIAPLLARELEHPGRFPAALAAGARALSALGLEAPLPVDAGSSLFVTSAHGRKRLAPGAAAPLAALTPDAGLRAVMQSLLLPAPAVVGGPGELAYWLQLAEGFDLLEAPRPVFLPRLQATLVEPRAARALEALGLDRDGLFSTEEELLARAPVADPRRALAVTEAADRAFDALERFGVELKSGSSPLRKNLLQLKKSYRAGLDKLVRQSIAEDQERHGVAARQIRLLLAAASPRGRPQERVLSAMPFLCRYGADLFLRLARGIDPFDFRHQLVEPGQRSADSRPEEP